MIDFSLMQAFQVILQDLYGIHPPSDILVVHLWLVGVHGHLQVVLLL